MFIRFKELSIVNMDGEEVDGWAIVDEVGLGVEFVVGDTVDGCGVGLIDEADVGDGV